MIYHERLARWLLDRLHRAVDQPQPPALVTLAQEMSAELTEKWLESEAQFWLSASQKRGLTPQQRSLRVSVSRFYTERLTAHRTTHPSRVRDTTEEGSEP